MKQRHLSDLILSIVSDDYESLEQIEKQVRVCLATEGDCVGVGDIADALHALEGQGLVSAYLLDPRVSQATKASIGVIPITELWFYASEKGRENARSLDEIMHTIL